MKDHSQTAIRVEHLSKTFRLPQHQTHTLKERVLRPTSLKSVREFKALRDVSLEVARGGFYGVVGRNGSGKSTLLKCLAGIFAVDSGSIHINGSVSTFIELGVGFNPDLAARDNIEINAAMLGLSRREARRRFDAVMDFSELHEFQELKLKNYSSGMLVRLAFAVMLEVDADVMLIDEVLAVGDAAFQQKCFDAFENIRRSDRTVLLVTHDMSSVRRFCDEALLLDHGSVVASGDSKPVSDSYLDLNFARQDAPAAHSVSQEAETKISGSGAAEILDLTVREDQGPNSGVIRNGSTAVATMVVRFNEQVIDPVFTFTLSNSAGVPLFTPSTSWKMPSTGAFQAGQVAEWTVRFQVFPGPDRYSVSASVLLHGGAVLHSIQSLSSLVITRSLDTGALVDLPFDQELSFRDQVSPQVETRSMGPRE